MRFINKFTTASSAWAIAAVAVALAASLVACSDTNAGSGTSTAGAGQDTGSFKFDASDGAGATDDTAAAPDTTQAPDSEGDGSSADTAKPDVSTVGDFGKACKSDSECESGWCIEGYNGYFCSETCGGSCPKGYVCQKVFANSTQPVFLCMAPVNKLCKPCTTDLDCSGGACVDKGGEHFCATPCGGNLPGCPASHSCEAMKNPDGSDGSTVCMPTSGTCACSSKSNGLVRACQQSSGPQTCYGIETCGSGQWSSCQLPGEVCNGQDDDCNGVIDDGFVDNSGKYATLQACGQCGINCSVLSGANAKAACKVSDSGAAQCVLNCDSGYFDVDDNPKTGCECFKTSATDVPDGPDQNCDGIDGEVDNGIFVALTGNDNNNGSLAAPLATIGAAIAKASGSSKRDVYVATGVYEGSLALAAGVNVYGGYSADFRFHDPKAYETVVLGTLPSSDMPGAVNAIGLAGNKATFDGFAVYGVSVKGKGASTYGIYVRDCDNGLSLHGNRVVAGDAGAGTPGTAGSNGEGGTAGTAGSNAKDIGGYTCTVANNTSGGKPGTHTCGGSDVSGGSGGTAVCPDYDEDGTQPKSSPYKQTLSTTEQGGSGKGSGGGKGGMPGYDAIIWDGSSSCGVCNPPRLKDSDPYLYSVGKNGIDGTDGAQGTAGVGCNQTDGAISGGLWSAGTAIAGSAGAYGSGGGGGGAGGGVEVTSTCTSNVLFKYPDVGGSGGGAGSGGCGATGGKAGGSGGGSFAVFMVYTGNAGSLPSFADNQLVTGNGGDGAPGGFGGVGGLGGDGQFGGADDPTGLAWCASGGGRGGQGGNGGSGGGGGGGCGGVSYGLFVSGASGLDKAVLLAANNVQILGVPGGGGAGGKSLGKSGGDGSIGAGGAANF